MFKWISFVLSMTEINVLFIFYLFYSALHYYYYSYSSACLTEKCIKFAENRLNIKCLRIRLNQRFSFFVLSSSRWTPNQPNDTINRDKKNNDFYLLCKQSVQLERRCLCPTWAMQTRNVNEEQRKKYARFPRFWVSLVCVYAYLISSVAVVDRVTWW